MDSRSEASVETASSSHRSSDSEEAGPKRVTVNLPKGQPSEPVRVRLPAQNATNVLPPRSQMMSQHLASSYQHVHTQPGPGFTTGYAMRGAGPMRHTTGGEYFASGGSDSWGELRNSPFIDEYEMLHYDLPAGEHEAQRGHMGIEHDYAILDQRAPVSPGQYPPMDGYCFPRDMPPRSTYSDWEEMDCVSPEHLEGPDQGWSTAGQGRLYTRPPLPRHSTMDSYNTVPDTVYSIETYSPDQLLDNASVQAYAASTYRDTFAQDTTAMAAYSEAALPDDSVDYANQHHQHHHRQHLYHVRQHHMNSLENADGMMHTESEYSAEHDADYTVPYVAPMASVYGDQSCHTSDESAQSDHSVGAEHGSVRCPTTAVDSGVIPAKDPQPRFPTTLGRELATTGNITTERVPGPAHQTDPLANYDMPHYHDYEDTMNNGNNYADGNNGYGDFRNDLDPEHAHEQPDYHLSADRVTPEKARSDSPASSRLAVAGSVHPNASSDYLFPPAAWSTIAGPYSCLGSRDISRTSSFCGDSDKENRIGQQADNTKRTAAPLIPFMQDSLSSSRPASAANNEAMFDADNPTMELFDPDPAVCDTRASSTTLERTQERTEELQQRTLAELYPMLQTVTEQQKLATSPPYQPPQILMPQPPPASYRYRGTDNRGSLSGQQHDIRMNSTPLAHNVMDEDLFGVQSRQIATASASTTTHGSSSVAVQVPSLSPHIKDEVSNSRRSVYRAVQLMQH
jgi:hypothetical protein